ncbi:hypothetical protein BDB00DRAFT_392723 [Zychaea mexicana]|uniref:uncharacterized protein n=1 Tax=Zychaea mexicana TaxID=64656 RepID=UPI0022FE60A5|nr:uncharacterized protein BDB00DRAFT_392723 [Zychaea mexicana]KAI9498608.1 hypothetical protein BDB00DRAFT_392723 [Zychaea mexicana]
MQSTTATDSLVRLQNVANQFPLKASNGSNNAVKNILHNDNNNEQQQVVEPQCSEKNNSFDTLPAEIQLKVFEHLSLRDCVLASIVCRSWHELALRRPSLWRCLVFDDNRSATAHLQTYCQRQYIRNTFVREIKVRRAVGERLSEIFGFAMEHKWDHIEKGNAEQCVLFSLILSCVPCRKSMISW